METAGPLEPSTNTTYLSAVTRKSTMIMATRAMSTQFIITANLQILNRDLPDASGLAKGAIDLFGTMLGLAFLLWLSRMVKIIEQKSERPRRRCRTAAIIVAPLVFSFGFPLVWALSRCIIFAGIPMGFPGFYIKWGPFFPATCEAATAALHKTNSLPCWIDSTQNSIKAIRAATWSEVGVVFWRSSIAWYVVAWMLYLIIMLLLGGGLKLVIGRLEKDDGTVIGQDLQHEESRISVPMHDASIVKAGNAHEANLETVESGETGVRATRVKFARALLEGLVSGIVISMFLAVTP